MDKFCISFKRKHLHIINQPTLLKKPLTKQALKTRADKDGRIAVKLAISLEDIMITNIDTLNDLANERILGDGGLLSDLYYEVVGYIPASKDGDFLRGQIILKVDADVSDLL